MLTFPSKITDHLKLRNTSIVWLLRLYYNDESAYLPLAAGDHVVGSDVYRGMVLSFGELTQSLNEIDHTVSVSGTTVKIANGTYTKGIGRFTDHFETKNFINRKWIIYLWSPGMSSGDETQIGQGVITKVKPGSDSISFTLEDNSQKYNTTIPRAKIQTDTPSSDGTEDDLTYYYPATTDNNVGKPIPIQFGEFGKDEDIPWSVLAHTLTDATKHPAVVVNKNNPTVKCDVIPLATSSNWAIKYRTFKYDDGFYSRFIHHSGDGAVTVGTSNDVKDGGTIKIITELAALFIPFDNLESYTDIIDPENAFDMNPRTYCFLTDATHKMKTLLPDISKLGEIDKANGVTATNTGGRLLFLALKGSTATTKLNFRDEENSGAIFKTVTLDSVYKKEYYINNNNIFGSEHPRIWSEKQRDEWRLNVTNSGVKEYVEMEWNTGANIRWYIGGIEILYFPDGLKYSTVIDNDDGIRPPEGYTSKTTIRGPRGRRRVLYRVPGIKNIDVAYFAHVGRMDGAYIDADSRTNNYNKDGAQIINPIYQVENVLRTELGQIVRGTTTGTLTMNLVDSSGTFNTHPKVKVGQMVYNLTDGTSAIIDTVVSNTQLGLSDNIFTSGENYHICGLTSSEIDYEAFDQAGSSEAGSYGDIYSAFRVDGSAKLPRFSYAIDSEIDITDYFKKVSMQTRSFIFVNGSGKYTIKTLKRRADYDSNDVDFTIDFKEMFNVKPEFSPLKDIVNEVNISYHYDYGAQDLQKSLKVSDSTSQGDTLAGIGDINTLEVDADYICEQSKLNNRDDTAKGLAQAILDFRKSQYLIIPFETSVKYSHVEIGDKFNITNFPADWKIYNPYDATPATIDSNDVFMIKQLRKSDEKVKIVSFEVS